ncbi:MAG: NADH-quinone oxidoreductase subunit NuoH [Planctomycetota bacterium]|nr:MAG: NADH-quinone oxidoreductase subunit NuoH [Planctomycetota bacterium]
MHGIFTLLATSTHVESLDGDWLWALIKAIAFVGIFLTIVPVMTWVERRGSAFIQDRVGPNRITVFGIKNAGLLFPMADGLKFLFKEDFLPEKAEKILYTLAPMMIMIPAFIVYAVVPFSSPIMHESVADDGAITRYIFSIQIAPNLGVGLLFVFAIASLGTYGIIVGGWSGGSKYSFLGSMRACAQMISYEIPLTLSVIGILMVYQTLSLQGMVAHQTGGGLLGISWLPHWGIFVQPLGFILFLVCAFAETNRAPFDVVESDSELVAGFHTDYSGFKFALFFMAEYASMVTMSALIVILFFGGWHIPIITPENPGSYLIDWFRGFDMSLLWASILTTVIHFAVFMAKTGFFLWLFIWVRWTLPRFRYDQLQALGWKVLLPLGLVNVAITALLLLFYGM